VELILVRHALPVRHEPENGAADPHLAGDGVRQADRLGAWLGREHVDAVVHSPARRAAETARPVADAHGLTPVVVDAIAEFDTGTSSYVPVEELRAAGDPRWTALAAGDLSVFGVDPVAFRAGVVAGVEALIDAHPGGRVVAVCHGGVINAYLGHVLGIDRDMWFSAGYASISRVAASRRGHRNVVSLNETAHLDDRCCGG
jgi:broad specificity phosphatase PhoE